MELKSLKKWNFYLILNHDCHWDSFNKYILFIFCAGMKNRDFIFISGKWNKINLQNIPFLLQLPDEYRTKK